MIGFVRVFLAGGAYQKQEVDAAFGKQRPTQRGERELSDVGIWTRLGHDGWMGRWSI